MHEAERTLRPCRPGECYSYTIPPSVGGGYTPRNMGATPLEHHFSIHGQIHRQCKALPIGTRIKKFDLRRAGTSFKMTLVAEPPSGASETK